MVESSRPWNGELLGDSGPYTADQWDNVWGRLFGSEAGIYADDGVIRNFANELAPTVGGANDCHVDTGAALVHGKFYRSDTLIHVNVPSATAGHWREDLICPQTNWAAQVIRVLRHANPNEDVVYPAPTQVDGTTWEIPICAARVTDAGVVTVADLRQFASDLMRPKKLFIPPAAYLPANTSWRYIGGHVAIRKEAFGAGELARFEFRIPPDFHEVVSAAVIFVNFGTNRADWTFYSSGAACSGANLSRWSASATENFRPYASAFDCIDVTPAFQGVTILPSDIVGGRFVIDLLIPDLGLIEMYVVGLVFEYR